VIIALYKSTFTIPYHTGKGGNVTSAGWQVTLCDPIWRVSSRSGEASCELLYSVYLYLTLPYRTRTLVGSQVASQTQPSAYCSNEREWRKSPLPAIVFGTRYGDAPCYSCTNLFAYLNTAWLGSRVISVLNSGAQGHGFKSQPRRCRVTVLGKLSTPIVPLFTKQRNW